MNDIIFVKGQGGLGRPLPGKDYISGMLFYSATLPSGFSTTSRIKQIFSLNDAVNLGIKKDNSDETQATGVYTLTTFGAIGDSFSLNAQEPTALVNVVKYVRLASDTTVTLLATSIVSAINARTYVHGYTATSVAGVITIIARKGLGLFPTGTGFMTAIIVGTIAGSFTTVFGGGVASNLAVWYYQISEYFREQPKGNIYIGIFAIPTVYDFSEINTMQQFSNGEIRQIGVYKDSTAVLLSADLISIQTICNALDALKQGLSVIFAQNIFGATFASLIDLSLLESNKVSVVISQDLGGQGVQLVYAMGKSVPALGAALGVVSFSNVQENIAWVGKFNVSSGTELETVGFANGLIPFTDPSNTTSFLDSINLKRYLFLRKFPSKAGTYFNDSYTAISATSDYAYIENNRVIDKAIRGVNEALFPSLNSPLRLNSNGTLSDTTIGFLESQALVIVNNMVRNSEISDVGVTINPLQNVASSSTLVVTISLVPIGVARNILVNIGFKTSL